VLSRLIIIYLNVQKEDVYLHPDLEFWILLTVITSRNFDVLDIFGGRK